MIRKSHIETFSLDLADPVDHVVGEILADVTDRRGWRQEWDGFDEDVQESIVSDWREAVRKALATETK